MEKACEACHKPYQASHQEQKYCSRTCYRKAICGPHHHLYKGGCVVSVGGNRQRLARVIYVNGTRVYEHRQIMEQVIGRPLTSTEVVHHVNGNSLDNRPENLVLMPNNSDHMKTHATFRSKTHKECSICHEVKPRTEFYKNGLGQPAQDPHQSACKCCHLDRRRRGLCPHQPSNRGRLK